MSTNPIAIPPDDSPMPHGFAQRRHVVSSSAAGANASAGPSKTRNFGRLARFRGFALAPFAFALVAGCGVETEGVPPPPAGFAFPVAAVTSSGGGALYVANSNFDLRYSQGSVQAIDLARLRRLLPPVWSEAPNQACGSLGLNPSPDLYPGPCGPIDLESTPVGPLVRAWVPMPPLATDMIYVARSAPHRQPFALDALERPNQQPDGARLFIPTRADPTLIYFDVDDDRTDENAFRLDCGQTEDSLVCDEAHRLETPASDDDGSSNGGRRYPFAVAATPGAEALAVTDQARGSVNLYTGTTDGESSVLAPDLGLAAVLTGLPSGSAGIAGTPPRAGAPSDPGFLMTFVAAPELDLLRFHPDPRRIGSRLEVVATQPVDSTDSRGVAVDTSQWAECAAPCSTLGPDAADCLAGCAATPAPFYVASRTPPALLSGALLGAPEDELGAIVTGSALPIEPGASNVVLGRIRNAEGAQSMRVFVMIFETRSIYVYNPESQLIERVIRTGPGPQAMAVDPVAPFGYVAHFTDSYIGVVDLDESHETFASIVATVGVPRPPPFR